MKCVIVLAFVVAAVSAQFDQYGQSRYSTPVPIRGLSNEQAANTISYVNDIYPDGSYRYAFNTDNGIAAEAQGTPKAFPGNPPVSPAVSQGSFSWTSPEGQPIAISYIADENGYQPKGDALPTPPPIPVAILKALDYIARNPQPQQK